MLGGVYRAARAVLWAVLLALAVSGSAAAQGDSSHYQTLQLGERSRGMAAAYTAFAADGAAIWFNPAGLPLLEPKLLQGSLSLVQLRKRQIEGAVVSDGPDGVGGEDQVEDFELRSSPSLGGFAVVSFALGKPRPELDQRKPVQIAISAFQLYDLQSGGDVNFQDNFGRTSSLQFYRRDRNTIYGAALGFRPIRKFLVGIGIYVSNRKVEHVETTSLVFGGVQDPSQGSPCPTSPTIPFCVLDASQVFRDTVFTMNAWYGFVRIGLLNILGKRWRFGVMFQPPGFRLGGKSTLRFELTDVVSSTNPDNPGLSDSIFGTRDFGSRSPVPWELRLGVSYVISKKVAVAADLQLVGPIPGGTIAPGAPELEDRANTSGILLDDSTQRDFTWNISVGTEIQINKFLFTRFGFLTDNSSAPNTGTGAAGAIRPADIDRFGFSASIGAAKNGKGLSAGVSVLVGRGTGNGLDFRNEAFENDTNFTRVPAKEQIYIISIGGDIGQTADVVKERMKEKKKEQAEEERAKERAGEEERTRGEIEVEDDAEVKAAKQEVLEARQARDEAVKEVEEADKEVERLEKRREQREEGQD